MADAEEVGDANSDRGALAAVLRREYEAGASIRQLASASGKTETFIRYLLAEAGVPLRDVHNEASEQDHREEAHRLVDEVPAGRVSEAIQMLRSLTQVETTEQPRRRFRTVGVFDGEPDLGRRAKAIARHELGRGSGKTA